MPTLPDAHIVGLARSCVHNMGDIFGDCLEHRDADRGFVESQRIATDAVATTLQEFAVTIESNPIYTNTLRFEYREIVNRVGGSPDDQRIISAMIQETAWTERGARTVLQLAKAHGTSILRNALALAEAMGIEDGGDGL